MPLSNKLRLIACIALASWVSDGYADAQRLPYPSYGDTPKADNPRNYPQPDPQASAPRSMPEDRSAPPRITPASSSASDADGGPPPTTGPSGTSGAGPDRYDEVGYATWYGEELGGNRTASGDRFDPAGFTAAHRTLPLGSYVEVTSLATGRTILVLINDRGPAGRDLLIDLSQAAAKALGINGRAAVRIRRVTPSPGDLTALRSGQPGAPRLDSPPALLTALRLRLPGATAAVAPASAPKIPVRLPTRQSTPISSDRSPTTPPVASAPARGGYFVQVAAFSSKSRAFQLAKSLGGAVSPAGSLWRVRLGPYSSAGQAAQARDGAARRGYGDARIVRED
jgi:rare lipoprotein A